MVSYPQICRATTQICRANYAPPKYVRLLWEKLASPQLQAVGSHRCRLSPLTVAELALVAWAALCACSGPLRCCAAEQIAQVVQVGRAQRGLQLGEAGFVELAGWFRRTTGRSTPSSTSLAGTSEAVWSVIQGNVCIFAHHTFHTTPIAIQRLVSGGAAR